MGARYIWGKYTAERVSGIHQVYRVTSESESNASVNLTKEQDYKFTMGTGCNCYSSDGEMFLTGVLRTYRGGSGTVGDYFGSGYILMANNTVLYSSNWKSVDEWTGMGYGLRGGSIRYSSELRTESYEYYVQGAFLEWVSASSRSAQPDGYSGGYYYTFQGQDNIDPQSVSIPESIRGGGTMAIQVNPSTKKKYEGIVSYQYQYRTDGGEWVTAGTSGAVSYSIKVPNNITTIQARVRAQDDIGFTSSTWVTSQQVTVIQNQPPTAPGSIEVKNAIAGQYATVTITEATDPDGYVVKYIFERQVDGGNWEQVSTTTTLAYFERVGAEWATVAYRACAVDNEETKGPYITSETFTVNVDFVVISGPPENLGDQLNLFGLVVTVSISDEDEILDKSILVNIAMDEQPGESLTVQSGEKIQINIDTRYLCTGRHTLKIHAEKEDHMAANADYIVNIPKVTTEMLARGEEVINQDDQGRVQCPVTFLRSVYGPNGKNAAVMMQEGLQMMAGSYTGTGASGQGSPNELVFPFAPRLLVLYRQDGTKMAQLSAAAAGGGGTAGGITFTMKESGVSWYAADADTQMNASEVPYGYYAMGNWTQEETQ